jgi:hypothetical protein
MSQSLSDQEIISKWNLPKTRNVQYMQIIKKGNEPVPDGDDFEENKDIEEDQEGDAKEREVIEELENQVISSILTSKHGRAEACAGLALQISQQKSNDDLLIRSCQLEVLQKHLCLLFESDPKKMSLRSQLNFNSKASAKDKDKDNVAKVPEGGKKIMEALKPQNRQAMTEKEFDIVVKQLVSHFDNTQYNAFKVKVMDEKCPAYCALLIQSEANAQQNLLFQRSDLFGKK